MRDFAVEKFLLWQRWQAPSFARTASALGEDAPRALPEDRPRYEELQGLLASRFRIDPERRILMRGEFSGQAPAGRPLSGLTVRWTPV